MKLLKHLRENKWFYIAVAAILALAITSRLVLLGDRVLHHDEGMLTYFAFQLSDSGNYVYTPQIHAPVLFYVEAILFKIFGAGNNIVRLGPAIFGVILVSIPLFFRKLLGRNQAITITVLILTSPILLYYSRFLVHTSLSVVFWLLEVLFLCQFFRKPSSTPLLLFVTSFVLGFAVSETSYIFAAVLVLFVPILYIFARKKFLEYYKEVKEYFKKNPYDLLSAFVLLLLVWAAVFSRFFTDIQSLLVSLPDPFSSQTALGFWMSQHKVHLGNQPWYYYFILILIYEPILIFSGILGIIDSIKKRSPFYLFLSWWTIAMLAGMAIAGEKFPWLILPGLLPLVVLAGYYIGTNWKKFRFISKAIWILLITFTVFNAIRLAYLEPADTKEIAVYVQTPQSYQQIIDKINKKCPQKDNACMMIDSNISWPNSWIFRDNGSLFSPEGYVPSKNTNFILIQMDKASVAQIPSDFTRSTVQLREWWVPNVCRKASCAKDFWQYFTNREIWNEKGGYDVYLYERK